MFTLEIDNTDILLPTSKSELLKCLLSGVYSKKPFVMSFSKEFYRFIHRSRIDKRKDWSSSHRNIKKIQEYLANNLQIYIDAGVVTNSELSGKHKNLITIMSSSGNMFYEASQYYGNFDAIKNILYHNDLLEL